MRKKNSSLNLKLTASRNFGSSHLSLCEFYQKQFGGLFCVILTRNTASTMFYFVFPISYSSASSIQHYTNPTLTMETAALSKCASKLTSGADGIEITLSHSSRATKQEGEGKGRTRLP